MEQVLIKIATRILFFVLAYLMLLFVGLLFIVLCPIILLSPFIFIFGSDEYVSKFVNKG